MDFRMFQNQRTGECDGLVAGIPFYKVSHTTVLKNHDFLVSRKQKRGIISI